MISVAGLGERESLDCYTLTHTYHIKVEGKITLGGLSVNIAHQNMFIKRTQRQLWTKVLGGFQP